jgi:hypothetical protein
MADRIRHEELHSNEWKDKCDIEKNLLKQVGFTGQQASATRVWSKSTVSSTRCDAGRTLPKRVYFGGDGKAQHFAL